MEDRTIEEYCRAIDKSDPGGGARSTDIAKALRLSKNTVALTLKKLALAGYIEMERYGRVRLARKGLDVAKKMNFRHRVIETFLFSELKMDSRSVHEEANAMEHWVSDELVRRLYTYIGKPQKDPHGRQIA
ncbi:MAG: metal-dependent transcriptional regulator [Candidatus Micrarchaeia archaeon]